MASFTVEKYTPDQKPLWDTFVTQAKNATFLFQRDFMDYHNDRFEDHSLMVFKKGKLMALLPANRVGDTVYSHQGLTYGSFILQESTKLLDAFEAFKSVLAFLHNQGICSLDIKIIPSFYNTLPADELEYFMFKANATLKSRDVIMLIDYRNRLSFQKNRREGINKAKRNHLELRVDSDFENFWNQILIPNLKNKHAAKPVHTLEEIKMLAESFPQNIKQVNVYKDDKIVAGTTVFLTETTVHPQYVSGNTSKNADGSLDLLYDFIIHHFKENRHYFDFNTSSENNGTILNKGLLFWKESCGARTFTIDNYVIKTTVFKDFNIVLK